jgi:carbonic anhydrase
MAKIETLIAGYREFYQKYFASGDGLYRDLSVGQSPKTLVIACSDSRVDPSIVTSASPGDLFVVRNVANLVPPYEVDQHHHGVSAALEFGVRVLNVEHIVVLGHSSCAGIAALLNSDSVKDTDFIGKWVSLAQAAKDRVTGNPQPECQHQCEKESIILSLDNLLTFPWIKSAVEAERIKLHGWYFSVQEGTLQEYDVGTGKFVGIGELMMADH